MFKHLFWPYNKYLRPEFFPIRLTYMSVKCFAFWKWIFAKNFLWFTATNPWFPLGGLYPSSKREILEQLPAKYVPDAVFIDQDSFDLDTIQQKILASTLSYPLIIKPDNGLRGLGITIFHDQDEFNQKMPIYLKQEARRWSRVIQKFIDEPFEIWVFYVRKPGEEKGRITGMVHKEFLSIVGNGNDTFQDLVHKHPRAKYHFPLLQQTFADQRDHIVSEWQSIEIVEIGTHSRWSTFVDASSRVTPELTELFDELAHTVDGFYYGRFDVRARDLDAVLAGEFKIMEINPTYGEPTWMYDPWYTFVQQQKILLAHRSDMYDIAIHNHSTWTQYATLGQWWQTKKEFNIVV